MSIKPRTKFMLAFLAIVFVGILLFYDFSPENALRHEIKAAYPVGDEQFVRSMNSILGPELLPGNRVETLLNGVEAFPAMLDAIRNAKRSVTLESYIYWSGQTGKAFTEALCERAKAGVKVNVLLDWIGSEKIDNKFLDEMKKDQVHLLRYHPVFWFTITKLNNRTHRKILVVDGKIAFTGGMGIADHWLGNADSKEHWRDTQFKLEGPAVAEMQAAFVDNWIETSGELLHGPDYFPQLEPVGSQSAQVFKSSPKEGSESARLMYLLSIASARKSILMSNAYFVPDDLSIQTLVDAAHRGVKIQIIAPGKVTDTKLVRLASRSRWGDLIEAGIEMYEYQPTMYHCKVMIVDGIWSSVGSTNFDNRSFRLNDECNLNVLNAAFAKRQIEIFEDDLKKSKRITFEDWKHRPILERLGEFFSGLLHHQL